MYRYVAFMSYWAWPFQLYLWHSKSLLTAPHCCNSRSKDARQVQYVVRSLNMSPCCLLWPLHNRWRVTAIVALGVFTFFRALDAICRHQLAYLSSC